MIGIVSKRGTSHHITHITSRQIHLPGGAPVASREFTVADEYVYNRAGAVRWVISHVLRYKRFLLGAVASMTVSIIMLAAVPRLTGTAFNVVLQPHPDQSQLALVALAILACVLVGGV